MDILFGIIEQVVSKEIIAVGNAAAAKKIYL